MSGSLSQSQLAGYLCPYHRPYVSFHAHTDSFSLPPHPSCRFLTTHRMQGVLSLRRQASIYTVLHQNSCNSHNTHMLLPPIVLLHPARRLLHLLRQDELPNVDALAEPQRLVQRKLELVAQVLDVLRRED